MLWQVNLPELWEAYEELYREAWLYFYGESETNENAA